MKKSAMGLLLLSLILHICACQQGKFGNFKGSGAVDDQTRPIALIGNDTLILKEYNHALNNYGWHREKNLDTMNFKTKVLRTEIVHRAARIKAYDYPLEMTPDIRNRLQDHLNGVLRQTLFQKKIVDNISISREDIEKYYEENKGEFWIPAQAQIAQIIFYTYRPYMEKVYGIDMSVTDEEIDSLVRKRAGRVLGLLQEGEDFAEMARLYSNDSISASRGGQMEPITKGSIEQPIDSIVFSMPVGGISDLIKGTYGYHIINVLDRKDEHYAPIDSNLEKMIRSRIEGTESRKMAAHYFDSLYAVTEININTAFFDAPLEDLDSSWWLMSFNNHDTIFYPEYKKWKENETKKNPKLADNPRFRRELLNVIGNTWLLVFEARKNGYDKDSAYLKASEDFLYQEKLNLILKGKFDEDYEPTEEELTAYYEKTKNNYTEDSAISIQQIILEDKNTADKVKALLDSGANFYQTALEYYPGEEDEIRKMAINLGWVTREDVSPEFFDKIYQLDVDEISKPIKTEWGHHIVKILGKKGIKPLDAVRFDVRKILVNNHKDQVLNNWEESMLSGIDVKVDYQLVKDFIFHPEWLPKPDFSKMFNPY